MVWPLAMVARHRPRALLNGLLLVLVLLGANSCGGAQCFSGGGPAPPSTAPATKISLPPEPPLVLAALQGLLRQSNPQLVQRIDSVTVKYVTDKAFWYSIASAWKTGKPASCGTGSGFATLNGHVYVVALHGKFVGSSEPGGATTYVSVAVDLVPAADLSASEGGSFGEPPVGVDGQPLCWSLLPG